MARTQKNKAITHHLDFLKAKPAKLQQEIFSHLRIKYLCVGFVGFRLVENFTLMNKLVGTYHEWTLNEFTTITCIPRIIGCGGAKLQLLDLPRITEGVKDGKWRNCNCILIVLDVIKPITDNHITERDIDGFVISLNKEPPNLTFRKRDNGRINFTSIVAKAHLSLETVNILDIPFH